MTQTADTVLSFWFNDIDPAMWWQKNDEFDQQITNTFQDLHHQATQGELCDWRETASGRLAEIIVLDQFSRNIYRDSPLAFASDAQALCLSQHAVAMGLDKQLSSIERSFLYMPYMHSESAKVHVDAVKLFQANGNENNLKFELAHKDIIDRFGRYPHRNEILGRTSTPEEIAFLKRPNSSF